MSEVQSVSAIRAEFAALERRHLGTPVAYFDGPGGTQVPRAVVQAITDYLTNHNANTHWLYPSSIETDALLSAARETYAAFFNGAASEVVFGNNMTTLTFHMARALGRGWQAGDEVVVTELDHHANLAPWQALARERGIVLRMLPLDLETFRLRLDLLPGLINSRTKLVAIGAASNALGTITDVAEAARIAHAAGALVYVDGVHYSPHVLPDVQALGCDFFVCSSYKFFGPHAGILWGRRELLESLDAPKLEPAPDTAPERFETGTQNHEGIVGAAAAVQWLASLAGNVGALRPRLERTYQVLHEREAELFQRLWDGLGGVPGLVRYGPPPGIPRTATIAFTLKDIPSADVAAQLVDDACFVSNGDFYATTVARRLKLESAGLVRIGAACYTTADEIDRVVSGVARIGAHH
ncbi:MAG: cysteine desulfurase-like protein [Gemmatimonadota bacterium]